MKTQYDYLHENIEQFKYFFKKSISIKIKNTDNNLKVVDGIFFENLINLLSDAFKKEDMESYCERVSNLFELEFFQMGLSYENSKNKDMNTNEIFFHCSDACELNGEICSNFLTCRQYNQEKSFKGFFLRLNIKPGHYLTDFLYNYFEEGDSIEIPCSGSYKLKNIKLGIFLSYLHYWLLKK